MDNIPGEIIQSLAKKMMPILSTRILEVWLDTAVPASLEDMVDYQKALALVADFAAKLGRDRPGNSFKFLFTSGASIWYSLDLGGLKFHRFWSDQNFYTSHFHMFALFVVISI
mgnify:CR=1 FL=1